MLHGADLTLRINYEDVHMSSVQDYYYHAIETPAVVELIRPNGKIVRVADRSEPMDLLFEISLDQANFMPTHVLLDILWIALVVLFAIVIVVPICNLICIARAGYRRPKPIVRSSTH